MWCAVDNYSYMCHICVKEFSDSNFDWAIIYKVSISTKLPQISHTHKSWDLKKKQKTLSYPFSSPDPDPNPKEQLERDKPTFFTL